jgi:hypothetical protein
MVKNYQHRHASMRNLTLVVMRCPKRSGMVGVEGIVEISHKLLQKGTRQWRRLEKT